MPARALLALVLATTLVHSALAWEARPRWRVTGEPVETTGAVEGVLIRCRPDFVIGVVTPGKRLRPDRDILEEEALFDDVFGKVVAEVDGKTFDLGAGGSADAPTLYLFPRDRDAFLSALHAARAFTLAFDILPEDAKDGEGFETVAVFDARGLSAALTEAGRACADPAATPSRTPG